MIFCTAHRPDYRPAPQPVLIPLADRRRTEPPRKPGQIYTDWASI